MGCVVVLLAALLSFGFAFAVGWVLFRRSRRSVGPSWEEWRDADPLGGRWAPLIRSVVGAATAVGLLGLGAPAELRGALLGTVAGFCAPFAVEGVRRFQRTRRLRTGHGW
jgi:hypothetical protein